MIKILILLALGFSALFLLCGCGVHVREYRSFESTSRPQWNPESIREYCTITPRHSQKKVLLFYWSDIYSEPYRLDFVIHSKLLEGSTIRVHEVVLLLPGETTVLHSKSSDPVEKVFPKKENHQYSEALFSFDLQDHLKFNKELEFETVISWSLAEDPEVRELKTKFKAVKSSDKSSIWSVLQGI